MALVHFSRVGEWDPGIEPLISLQEAREDTTTVLRIETFQRRFTRMIEEVGLLPYSEQLPTLAEERSMGDLIEVYKASQGLFQLIDVFNFSTSG